MDFSKLKGIAIITFQMITIKLSVPAHNQTFSPMKTSHWQLKKKRKNPTNFTLGTRISPMLPWPLFIVTMLCSFQLTFTEGGLSCDNNSAIQVMGKHTNRKSSTSWVIQITKASPEAVQSVKTERERKWKWNSWREATSSSPPTIGFSSLASATPPLPASFIAFLLFSTNSCKTETKGHRFLGPFTFQLVEKF